MKKTKKLKGLGGNLANNPVAKFAGQFNKAKVFKDKTKYQRATKHKGKEPFPMMLSVVLEKVSVFFVAVQGSLICSITVLKGLIYRYKYRAFALFWSRSVVI